MALGIVVSFRDFAKPVIYTNVIKYTEVKWNNLQRIKVVNQDVGYIHSNFYRIVSLLD